MLKADALKKIFSEKLITIRKIRGLTKSELSKKLGYKTTSNLHKYEDGTHFPHFESLYRLSEILEVPVDYFFNTSEKYEDIKIGDFEEICGMENVKVNRYLEDGEVVELRLKTSNCVVYTLVDYEDFLEMNKLKLRLYYRQNDGYIGFNFSDEDPKTCTLQSWILKRLLGDDVIKQYKYESDHRNKNRLDNRRSNLRLVSRAKNQENRRDSKTLVPGVSLVYTRRVGRGKHQNICWRVSNWKDGKKISGKSFKSFIDALEYRINWILENSPEKMSDLEESLNDLFEILTTKKGTRDLLKKLAKFGLRSKG